MCHACEKYIRHGFVSKTLVCDKTYINIVQVILVRTGLFKNDIESDI